MEWRVTKTKFDKKCQSCGGKMYEGDQVAMRKLATEKWKVVCDSCWTSKKQFFLDEYAAEKKVQEVASFDINSTLMADHDLFNAGDLSALLKKKQDKEYSKKIGDLFKAHEEDAPCSRQLVGLYPDPVRLSGPEIEMRLASEFVEGTLFKPITAALCHELTNTEPEPEHDKKSEQSRLLGVLSEIIKLQSAPNKRPIYKVPLTYKTITKNPMWRI